MDRIVSSRAVAVFPGFTLPDELKALRGQVCRFGEGPSEVHRMVIARSLFR